MKFFWAILLAIAILSATGAGTYVYFGSGKAAAAEGAGHGSNHSLKGNKRKSDDSFEFVEISPLMFPVIDKNGSHQMISLVVAVEVRDQHSAEMVTRLTPRLNDAYIQNLYGYLNNYVTMNGGPIHIGELKKRLRGVTADVIGKDSFNDVLLQVVQQRPI
jgi:flagellar FliL protein